MSDKTMTHKGLADTLGVSETTVKSYRRKFPGCIPVASEGKPIRFSESALDVAMRIRDHFATGMSVKEVRARLAQEFSWISPENEEQRVEGSKAMPEISQGVSNMAKSMVTMAQQQKAIVRRMQTLESQLEELGLKGVDLNDRPAKNNASSSLLEQRLNHLDTVTESLAGTVQILAGKLDRFLGDRAKSAAEWRQQKEKEEATENTQRTTVVSFSSGQKRDGEQPDVSRVQPPVAEPQEPPRQFYSLPLVVRTADGRYISAGGRGRGRFCLNDLKALLVYGFEPPMHYAMRWESHGDGWWLYLEQPQKEDGHAVDLLLMELPTQKSGNVLEVLQVKNKGEAVHPAEICAIIDGFSQ